VKHKNTAIAAALALLSLGAQAQSAGSSVTLYGRFDINITKFSGSNVDADNAWQMTQSSTSRIGLRGSEDLGGGMRAVFQLESAFDPDTGATGSAFWGRESWVGLRGNFGTVRLGRTLTPSQRVASNYDPHGTDGIGSFGSSGLLIRQSALPRFNDGIYYETPNLSGFTVFAGVQMDDVPGATDERFTSLRARYQGGALDVSVGAASLNPGNKVTSFGLAYDFKFVKPMMQLHTGQRNALDWRTWLVGLTAPLGTGELRAAYSVQDQRQGTTQEDRSLFAVGYDYPLSKRTLLYGTVARDTTERAVTAGTPPTTTTAKNGKNGFELGIRHNF
jgi:predicted porin